VRYFTILRNTKELCLINDSYLILDVAEDPRFRAGPW